MPSQFAALTVGEVPGPQHIDCAELAAAIVAVQLKLDAIVFSDSQYVLDIVALLSRTACVADLHKLPNYDLLQLLWHGLQVSSPEFRKIKTHAFDPAHESFQDTLGNEAADQAAKHALRRLQRVAPLHTDAFQQIEQRTFKQMHFRYLYDLQVTRAKLFQQLEHPEPIGDRERPWLTQVDTLKSWVPTEGFSYVPQPADHEALGATMWGSAYSQAILDWLQHVRWPDVEDTQGAGVSWYELTLSFQYATQRGIVVNVGGHGPHFRPQQLELNNPDIEFSRQNYSFERAISTLQTVLGRALVPTKRIQAKSVRILGRQHAKSGLAHRPAFPFQREICDQMRHFSLLAMDPQQSGQPLVPVQTPMIVWTIDPRDQEDADDWAARSTRYNRHRRRR